MLDQIIFSIKNSILLPDYNTKRIISISYMVFEKIMFLLNLKENKPDRVRYLYLTPPFLVNYSGPGGVTVRKKILSKGGFRRKKEGIPTF